MVHDITGSKARLADGLSPPSFWSNLSSGTRKAIIIVLIILLVVLVIKFISPSSFSIDWNRNTSNICPASKTLPEPREARAVSTADHRNMAKLEGYILVSDKYYLALDINKLTVDREAGVIHLEDECVRLSIDYRDTDSQSAGLINIEWLLKNSNAIYSGRCKLTVQAFRHDFPKDQFRYSCLDQQAHQCVIRDPLNGSPEIMAELILRSFELELDGDPEKIREGQFSKPPCAHSCIN